MKPAAASLLILLFAKAAGASQFSVPLHAPPRLWPGSGDGASLLLGSGFYGANAPGLHVEGLGGAWEAGAPMGERMSGHVQSVGVSLSGTLDPLDSRLRRTSGMAGVLEADLAFAPGGREGAWRLYGGGQVGLTVLGISGSGPTFSHGRLVVEPDTALSLTVGVPLGVEVRREWDGWRAGAAAHLTLSPGGRTVFTYLAAGPAGFGSTRRVHPFAALGTRLRLERPAWRLGLEGGVSGSSSSGNNEAVTTAYGALMLRLF